MKRDTDKDPYDVESGFNATLLYQSSSKELKALNSFQVITDDSMFKYYKDRYKIDSLNSAMVEGEVKRYYEFDLKEAVNIREIMRDVEMKEDKSDSDIPNFVQVALDESDRASIDILNKENEIVDEQVYDIDKIEFEEINCAFIKTESINALDCVMKTLQEVPYGVLAIKAAEIYQPYTLKLLSAVDSLGIYENIIPVTCHDNMKNTPYAFFKDLISSVFEYTVSQKLVDTNDFSMFANLDPTGLIKDLITFEQKPMQDIQKIREQYMNLFLAFMENLPNTLIYIENFEKIDISSFSALEEFFNHLEELHVSYLISYDKEYSLHKKLHFMLSRPYYTEVELTATPFKTIIGLDYNYYKNILNDFYFQRVAKYACGSVLYLDFAIQYLMESGVYEYADESISMVNSKVIVIPAGLNNLIKRRLNLLKNDTEIIRFLATLLLLGTRIDEKTIETLDIQNWRNMAESLSSMGYIYSYNNCIYFSNYNTLRNCMFDVIKKNDLEAIKNELFEKVYDTNKPSPEKAYLYDEFSDGTNVIAQWEQLANLNLSTGDFFAYLNCCEEILKVLNKYATDWTTEDLHKYKLTLFDNIASNMYEYTPEYNATLAKETLQSLKDENNTEKYIELCTNMVQGSMVHGDYMYAKELMHGILSYLNSSSIDPVANNFNLHLLLMSLIYVKILFMTGEFDSCSDIGYNILNVLDEEKLKSIDYTNSIVGFNEFKFLISECVGYIALVNIFTLKEDVNEFLNTTKKLLPFIPVSYEIFVQLQNLIKGQNVSINKKITGDDLFSEIIYHIINAFISFKAKPEEFAKEIYKSKIIAQESMMYPFELFADTMIGYAYIKLKCYKKSFAILNKIIETARQRGYNAVEYSAYYITSILNIAEDKYELAYGVLNNSEILMQKNGFVSDYITMLNKVNMYKVLMNMNSSEQAQICLKQAEIIVKKHKLNFDINIDIKKIMSENADIGNAHRTVISESPIKQEVSEEKIQEEREEIQNSDDEFVSPEDFFS